MATYNELKTEIESNGWTVLNETTGTTNNSLTPKTILAGKVENGAVKTKTFNITLYENNGEHYWMNADPFQDTSWYQELRTYLKDVVDGDNPFEAAYILNIDAFMERARVLATFDNAGSYEDRLYSLWKDAVTGEIKNNPIDVTLNI